LLTHKLETLAVLALFSAVTPAESGEARRGAAPVTTRSAEALKLPADFYPVLPWDVPREWREAGIEDARAEARLRSIQECGFTMAGFVQPRDLPVCEKLGLKAIVAPPPEDEEPYFGPWRTLTDDQIDQRIRRVVAQAGQSPAVIGYFLTDEPGTPMFPALGKAVAAVKRHAPGKLAYINLFPSYATTGAPDQSQLGAASFTEYVERFVREVKPQFLSYDNYAIQMSDDGVHAPTAALYYRDLLEVRRVAHKYGLPWWNIVASAQIQPEFAPPSASNLLLQAYTTLAAGADAVCWYKYLSGGYPIAPLDASDRPMYLHPYMSAVNQQVRTLGPIVSQLCSTGVYFSEAWPSAEVPLLPGRVVQSVEAKISPRGHSNERAPVMVGEFAGADGTDYVMIVNLSLQHAAHITFNTQAPYRTRERVSPEDGRPVAWNDKDGMWLIAGQGVLVRLIQ
jgi:hypothetical protein